MDNKGEAQTYLLNVLQFECALVDGGVRNIVTFGILKHQGQIRVHMLNTLIFIALHLVPVGNYGLSHLGRRVQEHCTVQRVHVMPYG